MTITQLKYYCEACRWESINKAADELFVTQPAISNAIKKLEEEYQTTLILRQGGRWQLTASGRFLLDAGRKLVDDADSINAKMVREFSEKHSIRIGMSPAYAVWVLQQLREPIEKLKKKYADLELKMFEISSDHILEAFAEQKIDLLFCTVLENMPDYLELVPIKSFDLSVCVSRRNPLSEKRVLSVADIKDEPLIVNYDRNSLHGRKLQELCDAAGITLNESFYFRQTRTVKELVRDNMAICFAREELSGMEDEDIAIIPLEHSFSGQFAIAYDNRFPVRNELSELITLFLKNKENTNA